MNEIFNYKFKNQLLLNAALMHASINNTKLHQHSFTSVHYETLEFLGDSVINLIVSEELVRLYGSGSEGDLSKRQAVLVSGNIMSKIALQHNIGQLIIMSEGEESKGGRENKSNLENTLEAIAGAIFLDSDYNNVKNIILPLWKEEILNLDYVPNHPKTELQEIAQSQGLGLPLYNLVDKQGSDHEPIFTVELDLKGYPKILGSGKSKRDAEIQAATLLINFIKEGK